MSIGNIGQQTVTEVNKSVTYTDTKSQQKDNLPVAEIARQVTVRVLAASGSGSGVIVARKGKTYTVLTCQHVLDVDKGSKYSILSADGKTYQARLKSMSNPKKVDLALIEFDSQNDYKVVTLGNSNLLTNDSPVFAAGFPNYHTVSKDEIEDTREWGTKAFTFTDGKVSMVLKDKSLPDGYSFGYTNDVKVGMSGGPVLNVKGELVGINGRLKFPIQGIEVFTFTDGSKPSQEIFEQMEPLSWAIPIVVFRQLAEKSLH
ncbi:MAG: serine protease [Calothrix sp. FI2-JRJ7]|nr:serine protease [Calothrix sp. FI2-JRJ7]